LKDWTYSLRFHGQCVPKRPKGFGREFQSPAWSSIRQILLTQGSSSH
jgi:hypothetical protein